MLLLPSSVLVYKDKMYHKMITQKREFLFNSFLGYSLLLGMKVMKPSIDTNIFPDRMWYRRSSNCKTKEKFTIGFQNIQWEILDQMDLTDIYRTFHPTAAEYTFFPNTQGTSSG